MKGFFVGKNDCFINRTEQPSAILKLLATDSSVDVMTEEMLPGSAGCLVPGDDERILEFFYVLTGEIQLIVAGEETRILKDEYFYVKDLKENIPIFTKNGAKILYITTKPIFKYITKYSEDLKSLLDRSHKKDDATHEHSGRVQDYAVKIARKLRISNESFFKLGIASLFHDIGKDFVPDEVLNKPGALTEEEFDIIKRHTNDGYNLVKEKFHEEIGRIVYQHHEHIDGSGYPLGIKGNEISIEAKIIAVADVFDAMTSDRPYKKAMSARESFEEIVSYRDIYYDAEVVDALQTVLTEEGELN